MYLKSPYPEPPVLPEVNAHQIFFNRPEQAEWPDFVVHIDVETEEQVMYREFVARIRDLATGLGAPCRQGGMGMQVEDGEIIGIMAENSSEYITLVHSCMAITIPFALISPFSTAFELKHALTLSKPTRLFVDAKFLKTVVSVAKEIGMDLSNIYLLKGEGEGRRNIRRIVQDTRDKQIPPVDIRPATKDTLAYLVFSSGTSGLPKAVMISHGNLICNVVGQVISPSAAVFTPEVSSSETVILAYLPLHHSYGLTVYCFRSCMACIRLVFMPKWDIELALKAIPRYKVSLLTLIPSIIHQFVNYPGIEKADFSSVTSIGSGGAYLPSVLKEKMVSLVPRKAVFVDGYGMSEVTAGVTMQPLPGALGGKLQPVAGSVGVLMPGIEARTVRDDGTEAGVNEVGELWLRGGNISIGYWNNAKATAETFVDGWLHTGDQFKIDEKGNLWFADRVKDTLKVSGAQVSPLEIENCLLEHPGKLITDVTVAGVSGGRTSDEKVPRAWIVLSLAGKKRGASAVVKELESWHRKNLSKYKWLRGGMEVVEEIPKSPAGKVLRGVLQGKYELNVVKNLKGKL